jgi:hypothetical protein
MEDKEVASLHIHEASPGPDDGNVGVRVEIRHLPLKTPVDIEITCVLSRNELVSGLEDSRDPLVECPLDADILRHPDDDDAMTIVLLADADRRRASVIDNKNIEVAALRIDRSQCAQEIRLSIVDGDQNCHTR